MKVIITGASGFLGSRVADALLQKDAPYLVDELVLVDTIKPNNRGDPRVQSIAADLTSPGIADNLIDSKCDVFFHLAAIVSGHAEADFDLGFKVNFDATRSLLEAARKKAPSLKFIYTSTLGVFGGKLPAVVDDLTAVTPENTYGTTKAMSELLINDYSRKGFVDGRVIRLPTVSVRPGLPNKAVTSFASGIIREPLNGKESICPVDEDLKLWLTSPRTVIKNIIHAAVPPASSFGTWRGVNLPGITVSVKEMIEALQTVAGSKATALIRYKKDEIINRIVSSFPTKFYNSRALQMGFVVDSSYVDAVKDYIKYEL